MNPINVNASSLSSVLSAARNSRAPSGAQVSDYSAPTSYPLETFTGMTSTEPVIILSSEFMPLYSDSNGRKSKQGDAVSLKEASKILTANAAITVLFQSTVPNTSPSSLIENNSKDLSAYVNDESRFISQLMLKTNNVIDLMSISSFTLPSLMPNIGSNFPFAPPAFSQDHLPKSFYDILLKCGYASTDISRFYETKLWQQTLVEIKLSLLAQSPSLAGQTSRTTEPTDASPFLLSEVASATNRKRAWLNYYQQTDQLTPIAGVDAENLDTFNNTFTAFSNFDSQKYFTLIGANYKTEGSTPTTRSSKLVEDIGLISSILFKEAAYSSFLNDLNNKLRLQKIFGYVVTPGTVNLAVWDNIVGKFSTSPFDSSKDQDPVGSGNSLLSLSQDTISNTDGYYNVLTFEKNVIENYSITPGVDYYIDGAFNTTDGNAFDTSRLDYLISKTNSALETTKLIFDFVGYEIQPHGSYKKKEVNSSFRLDEIIQKLSIVSTMYQSCIAGDGDSGASTGFDLNKLNEITRGDNINIRFAAVICKCTVSPLDSYKSFASKLKTYLFSLFMRKISNPTADISKLTINIFSILKSHPAQLNDTQLFAATNQLRTFPFTADSYSGYEVVKESHVIGDDTIDRSNLTEEQVKAAFDNNMLIKLDLNSGLWQEIFLLMKALDNNSSIFSDNNTSYSGLSKVAYLYSYFDLLMRVIADQTPENLLGNYNSNISRETDWLDQTDLDAYATLGITDSDQRKYQFNAIERGLVLDLPTQTQINDIYSPAVTPEGKRSINKFNEAISSLKAEDDLVTSQLNIVRSYILSLSTALTDFKTLLQDNFSAHVGKLNGLYKRDTSLTDKQRLALINMSFTEEQLRLSSYVMSEMKDRLSASGSGDLESKLKSMPAFSTLPGGFSKFLPVNETEIISYAMLSPYFKSPEFLNSKGNNMKIMSIGIPPKLNRSLRASSRTASDNASGIKKSIIRIKIYKIDRLLPAVVYLPKTYLFEMNRFPTRIISNWSLDSFSGDQINLFNIPSKLMLPDSNVLLQRNFDEAFPDSIYSDMLTTQEKQQIYKNHSMSFLSEEYLRWFTDCRFDETRYNKFNNLDSSLTNIESQFQKFVDIVKKNSTTDTGQKVHASFVDPTSGQTYNLPIAIPVTTTPGSSESNQATAQGQFILPMNDTIKAYFNYETLMSDPDIYKRRISYFKKFDRVFSLLIDPDDFYVDKSVTDAEALFSLAANGTLAYQVDSDSYKHRDTTPQDTTLDEYFLTIEPYDYVQQSM